MSDQAAHPAFGDSPLTADEIENVDRILDQRRNPTGVLGLSQAFLEGRGGEADARRPAVSAPDLLQGIRARPDNEDDLFDGALRRLFPRLRQ